MSSRIVHRARILAFFPFLKSENPHDSVDEENYSILPSNETKIDRLKNLFRLQKNNEIHPALVSVFHTTCATFCIGGIYGGIKESRNTFINFIETNQATQFNNHLEAKKLLSDKMFLGFTRGAAKWGTKICFFSTSFALMYTLLTVLNEKVTIFNYTFGGMYAGMIYKFSLGPKGMISGGFFGAFFGSLYGGLRILLLKLANVTEQDAIGKKYELKVMRDESLHDARNKLYLKKEEKEFINLIKQTDRQPITR